MSAAFPAKVTRGNRMPLEQPHHDCHPHRESTVVQPGADWLGLCPRVRSAARGLGRAKAPRGVRRERRQQPTSRQSSCLGSAGKNRVVAACGTRFLVCGDRLPPRRFQTLTPLDRHLDPHRDRDVMACRSENPKRRKSTHAILHTPSPGPSGRGDHRRRLDSLAKSRGSACDDSNHPKCACPLSPSPSS